LTKHEFVSVLTGGVNAKGPKYICPAHPDKNPSLSVNEKDGKILLHCHAGCPPKSVVDKLGLNMSDLFTDKAHSASTSSQGGKKHSKPAKVVAEYVYRDEGGKPVAKKIRFKPKSFAWMHLDGGEWKMGLGGTATGLYRWNEVKGSSEIILVEGEKDADAGAKLGLACATSGGVNSWREDHAELLRGKSVIILADADDPGRQHAAKVANSLYGKAASVKLVEIPGSRDLAEAIEKNTPLAALQGLFSESPEWMPTAGADLLDEVYFFLRSFVWMTEAQARVIAIWAAHTHAFAAAEHTPYLAIISPEKECGKSRLLTCLSIICANPFKTDHATAAALVMTVHGERPTLLLDEVDAAFKSTKEDDYSEALRGLLNSGFENDGQWAKCVGQGSNQEVRHFKTFCPKALAGIGKIPDTVMSRSIPIHMQRAPRGAVKRARKREIKAAGLPLAGKLAEWTGSVLEVAKNAQPEIPEQLSDRQADMADPLIALADLAGGKWPEELRRALVELCGQAQQEDNSPGLRLLADIRDAFGENQTDRFTSGELCKVLAEIETSPWAEWNYGKPITPMRLAILLKRFFISPKVAKICDKAQRCYLENQFKDAFGQYLDDVKSSENVSLTDERYTLKA
jgi:5S rRNA maturation endonuclease (ribonuclease M5)